MFTEPITYSGIAPSGAQEVKDMLKAKINGLNF